MKYVFEDLL